MKTFHFTIILLFITMSASSAEVNVTIYNQNVGLVREVRELKFPLGEGEIRFTDVAARIIPSSVHFSCEHAELLEQNFEFDLVDAEKLASRYIDHNLELIDVEGELFRGKLLSINNGYILGEKDGSVRLIAKDRMANIHFPELPEGLITRPTLIWSLNSEKAGKREAEISYLTFGMDWETEYVAVVNEEETAVRFNGWANIENLSGAAFENAKLKLIAGDVKMSTREEWNRGKFRVQASSDVSSASRGFVESSFHEYHLYTLQQPSKINNNQRKQISLFPSADVVKVRKELKMSWNGTKGQADVIFEFENTDGNGLGMPLPSGLVRVYKAGLDGNQEFIGEDRISHTPRNEKFSITTGKAFDIVGERKVIDSKRYYGMKTEDMEDEFYGKCQETFKDKMHEAHYEEVLIKVRNHKLEIVEVHVNEFFPRRVVFEYVRPRWTKKNPHNLDWYLTLEPEEEVTITYSALRN